jgi:hypothetical protein
MPGKDLITAVQSNDLDSARLLLSGHGNTEIRDEHGWTPLCWAAGAGNIEAIELLLQHGADPFAAGSDQRTPYQIAAAAEKKTPTARLAKAEVDSGRSDALEHSSGRGIPRRYCRAYKLADLRRFPGWRQAMEPAADDSFVFLHGDLKVTQTISPDEGVLYDDQSVEWRTFCAEQLHFQIPENNRQLVIPKQCMEQQTV